MLKRKITKVLEEWKNEENKQCLLIHGARQVGKTFIIEQFCKQNYESYIYINFDLSPTMKDIFNGDLDADTLIMKLEVTFPEIEIKKPASILAQETISSMQAGLVYGQIGQTEYIIKTVQKETGYDNLKVVATGGLGRIIAGETDMIQEYNSALTLEGLRIIYEKNRRK